ncbi:MAG: hypothetical protein AAF585_18340, partial [Verrucomicrobiota bacterium]
MKKLITLFLFVPAFAFAQGFAPGLLVTEYPRHPDQIDQGHAEVPHEKFGEPIGVPFVTESATPWRHNTERNAVARGFLSVKEEGEYEFVSVSFGDRNKLLIDGKEVCGYLDGNDSLKKIHLSKGLHKLELVGYIFGRGSSGIRVHWRPPGQREVGPIPVQQLLHRADKLLANYVTVVAKDMVIEAFHNGEPIPDEKRQMLDDTADAAVERINVTVREGDWLVFHVAHNRVREPRSNFFALAGNLDANEFGFVSDPESGKWTTCDEPSAASEFIAFPNSEFFLTVARAGLEVSDGMQESELRLGLSCVADP